MKKFKRVYVEITNICNLNCRFCEPSHRKQQYMELKDVEYVFSKIKTYTDFVYLHIKGEPLMHPQISEILELLEQCGMQAVITTNGTLINQNLEILANSKTIRQINISLHSIEQNEKLIINKNKYVKNLLEAVEKITEQNKCYISYRLWNLEKIGENEKNMEILNAIKEYYNIPNLLELVKNNDFIKISEYKYINIDTVYDWPSLQREIVSTKGSCYGLISQIAILVDGTVVPCCLDHNGDIKLGNIFNENLEKILVSNKTQEIVDGFKKQILTNPLCQRCGFRESKRR